MLLASCQTRDCLIWRTGWGVCPLYPLLPWSEGEDTGAIIYVPPGGDIVSCVALPSAVPAAPSNILGTAFKVQWGVRRGAFPVGYIQRPTPAILHMESQVPALMYPTWDMVYSA